MPTYPPNASYRKFASRNEPKPEPYAETSIEYILDICVAQNNKVAPSQTASRAGIAEVPHGRKKSLQVTAFCTLVALPQLVVSQHQSSIRTHTHADTAQSERTERNNSPVSRARVLLRARADALPPPPLTRTTTRRHLRRVNAPSLSPLAQTLHHRRLPSLGCPMRLSPAHAVAWIPRRRRHHRADAPPSLVARTPHRRRFISARPAVDLDLDLDLAPARPPLRTSARSPSHSCQGVAPAPPSPSAHVPPRRLIALMAAPVALLYAHSAMPP
ncbi:hypothetical protein EVG20_g8155 [Dentipellis fragilis]|uniref:Uncharacterized protein n=1 Tax=Dentipellis fragilis TaxID=205917 RepID=A0A4Y9YA42_9AGAM|nr:hypothetical protein EVG20_g8155 [Dentipellis fragilis]